MSTNATDARRLAPVSASATRRATVDFPDPVPPAMPITRGLLTSGPGRQPTRRAARRSLAARGARRHRGGRHGHVSRDRSRVDRRRRSADGGDESGGAASAEAWPPLAPGSTRGGTAASGCPPTCGRSVSVPRGWALVRVGARTDPARGSKLGPCRAGRGKDRGPAVHFRCGVAGAAGLRVDVGSHMRGVDVLQLLSPRSRRCPSTASPPTASPPSRR